MIASRQDQQDKFLLKKMNYCVHPIYPAYPVKFVLFLLLSVIFVASPLPVFALTDVSVSASVDPGTLYQGWPIKGTLEITHYADQKVDESSAAIEGKPLKISLLRNVQISPDSKLAVSIYQYTLPAQNKGSYLLPPITVKVGGKAYQTFSSSYEVKGPISPPPTAPGGTQESNLKLEAYIEGPKELYPGQKTKLVYRYIYQGNIDLSKELLPMLEAEGLQKIGRTETNNYTEGQSSIFEISQVAQAIKPGSYSWGPSVVEGVVYVEDALGNKQFTTTKLSSQAAPVTLVVKPFPEEGKPASFNGAFGQLTFQVKLTSPAKISVGDPIVLEAIVSGKTSNWDSVTFPDLCCQPGFAGFFKQSDLPPVGKMQGESKSFNPNMNPLSSAIKSIPVIQFSYFDPDSGKYKIIYSTPLPISVAPMQEISESQSHAEDEKKYQSPETADGWLQIYRQLPEMDAKGMLPLDISDLKNNFFGAWWILWFIPLSIAAVALQLSGRKLYKKLMKEKSHDA